jgi:hypothetical protein
LRNSGSRRRNTPPPAARASDQSGAPGETAVRWAESAAERTTPYRLHAPGGPILRLNAARPGRDCPRLQLAGAPGYINDLFNGVALIIAVALAVRSTRRKADYHDGGSRERSLRGG